MRPFSHTARVALAAAATLALFATGAAAYDPDNKYLSRSDAITPELGNSVRHNIAVQTVHPWPRNVRSARISIDGERALKGIRRYKANDSIPPRGLSTQSISTENSK